MTIRRSFKSATNTEDIEFDVNGEVFHARPKLPAGIVLRFADTFSGDEDEDGKAKSTPLKEVIGAVTDFFKAAIVTDDYDRFMGLLEDPDRAVTLDELMEIAGWLAGVYTARPTGTPSPDTSSPNPSGTDSTDGASPGVLTYSRPEPTPVASSA